MEVVWLVGKRLHHGFAKRHGARAALGKMFRRHRIFGSGGDGDLAQQRHFGIGVGAEAVHRHHHRNAGLAHVFNVPDEVRAPFFQ